MVKKIRWIKSSLENIETLFRSRNNVIKLYHGYKLKLENKVKHGEGLNILTTEQMLLRLPIHLAQVKAFNTNENLLN